MTIILTLSFLLLATIACLVLINSDNPFLKAGLVITTIWWAIAMYFIPSHFAGFPKQVDILPHNAWVLSYKIVEPLGNNQGGMYFWVIEKYENDLKVHRYNPMMAFRVINSKEPRAYKLPYSRKMHKQLEQAQKNAGQRGGKGGLLRFKHHGGGSEEDETPKGKFEIVNPVDLLPPKD
jgi:hypothetical protein